MEEIHDAIQDARYMGAMADPFPRPSMPLVYLEEAEIEEIVRRLMARQPNAFAFTCVLRQVLGFFMFMRYARDSGHHRVVAFLEDVVAFKATSFPEARLARAERIARHYLEAAVDQSVVGELWPPVGRLQSSTAGDEAGTMTPKRASELTGVVEAAARACLARVVPVAAAAEQLESVRPAAGAGAGASSDPGPDAPPGGAAPRSGPRRGGTGSFRLSLCDQVGVQAAAVRQLEVTLAACQQRRREYIRRYGAPENPLPADGSAAEAEIDADGRHTVDNPLQRVTGLGSENPPSPSPSPSASASSQPQPPQKAVLGGGESRSRLRADTAKRSSMSQGGATSAAAAAFAPPPSLFDEAALQTLAWLRRELWDAFMGSESFRKFRSLRCLEETPTTQQHFSLYRVLGRGSFGTVSACKKRNTGMLYARKVLSKSRVLDSKAQGMVWNERNLLASVRSPFVLSLTYAYQTEEDLVLVTDIMTGGDLGFHLRQARRFSEARARFHAAEVLLGLQHLHSMGVAYRDLKPSNVMLSQVGHACITDLGLAAKVPEHGLSACCGTRGYWAPEVLQKGARYGTAADWWSFGCMVVELLLGRNPFRAAVPRSLPKEERAREIDRMTLTWDVDNLPRDCMSEDAHSLCRALLTRDASKRLGARGAEEVRRHPWFQHLDWGLLETMQVPTPFKPDHDINAMSQEVIGSFRDTKRAPLTEEQQSEFQDWEYVSADAVQRELVQFMKWEELQGKLILPSPEEDTCCGDGKCCSVQ